ncbi:hypothetical protein ACET4R_19785 [Pseudomonas aeruginosa]|uniref:hypothetical protein n=1 Tax=Pseudomonas aeruginosa TaxID=287 RepID=UPI0036EFC227|nr:hypothetical protein [Pseudomonas aeruginosa]
MTSSKSSLFIRHLIVVKDGRKVYDQQFGLGVNIIRGANSVGKSTIMDLIFYGLGGDLKAERWTKESASCDRVILELIVNGRPVTISRGIEVGAKPPINMFSGSYVESLKNATAWVQYGPVRTDNKYSFSQQLFELLDWPAHQSEDGQNLTMHQVLRMIYVDQETPVSKILRTESAFDSPSTRKAIGDFLLGVDDLDTYRLRQQLSKAEAEYSKISGQLEAVYRFISPTEGVLRVEHLEKEISEATQQMASLMDERGRIALMPDSSASVELKAEVERLAGQISLASKDLSIRIARRAELASEIVESELFIEAIKARIKALQESRSASKYFGDVTFKYCPSCLGELSVSDENTCHVCKGEKSESQKNSSYLAALNELNFQLKESGRVLQEYRTQLSEADGYIAVETKRLDSLRTQHKSILTMPSDRVQNLSRVSVEIGGLEERISTLKSKTKLVTSVDGLVGRKEGLAVEVEKLREDIKKNIISNEARESSLESDLSERTLSLLRQDGGFETAFIEPETFQYDFYKDLMRVDGRTKFSASSETVIKNSFHLAVLQQSLVDEGMRYPKLLLMDNIEDKGMGPERSQNYQRLLLRSLEGVEEEYQVIMTTSMIDPEINKSNFCVGPFYAKGMHTLDL